jgi:hypothetical protein
MTGKFVKGYKGGPGNPIALHMAAMRKAIMQATSPEDVQRVWKSLYDLALGGDVTAMRLYLEYAAGKPKESLVIEGPEGGPVKIEALLAVVLAALTPYPEARTAVAHQLRKIPYADASGS